MLPVTITFLYGPKDGCTLNLFYVPAVMWFEGCVKGRQHKYTRWPESSVYIYCGAIQQ